MRLAMAKQEQLTARACALERRYPGVKVSSKMGAYHDGQQYRWTIFSGTPSVLLGHGLLPPESTRGRLFDELGTSIYVYRRGVPPDLNVEHFELIDNGHTDSSRPRSHPDNKKTRAIVAKLIARINKGVAHG
jgi:hypothetical protein